MNCFRTKTITKHFDTLMEAEHHQEKLCNRYDYVRLVRSPLFEESGIYAWEVR